MEDTFQSINGSISKSAKNVLILCTEILVFNQQIFMAKYSLLSANTNNHAHSDERTLLCLSFSVITMLPNEAIPFVVYLSVINNCLCLFHVSLKLMLHCVSYYTVWHCRGDKVQNHTLDLFSFPNPTFNTSHHVSTCCMDCLLSNIYLSFSCDRYVTLPYFM